MALDDVAAERRTATKCVLLPTNLRRSISAYHAIQRYSNDRSGSVFPVKTYAQSALSAHSHTQRCLCENFLCLNSYLGKVVADGQVARFCLILDERQRRSKTDFNLTVRANWTMRRLKFRDSLQGRKPYALFVDLPYITLALEKRSFLRIRSPEVSLTLPPCYQQPSTMRLTRMSQILLERPQPH